MKNKSQSVRFLKNNLLIILGDVSVEIDVNASKSLTFNSRNYILCTQQLYSII
jgi:hypothetical protein